MYIASYNRTKKLKTPILGVQGRSRSSMLVPLERTSAVLVMIRGKSVSICNRFHARWANSGKITISKKGTPLWCPRSRGISSPSGTTITSLETRVLAVAQWRFHDPKLRRFDTIPQCDRRTDRRKDASAVAKTRLALHAVARKNCKRVVQK